MSSFHFIQETKNRSEIKRRFVLCPDGVSWAVTGDFADMANNHCCATLLTNYSVFLDACHQNQIATRYLRVADYKEIFAGVHHFVGNGPVLRIDPKANAWFDSANINARCRVMHGLRRALPAQVNPDALYDRYHASTDLPYMETEEDPLNSPSSSRAERAYIRICSALTGGNPCALLVAAGPLNWHWIMAVGFVEYKDGGHQLLIVDNWTRRGFHLYYPDDGCRLLSCSVISAE